MRLAQIAVQVGDGEIFGDVNLRLLQPTQEFASVFERDAGILHAREPLSSFLADQLTLPVRATIRVAVFCVAHHFRTLRATRRVRPSCPAERGPLCHRTGW